MGVGAYTSAVLTMPVKMKSMALPDLYLVLKSVEIDPILGILAGAIMAQGISAFAGWETTISIESAVVAFLVSGLIGVAFGLYPARRAAFMSPITALRFE